MFNSQLAFLMLIDVPIGLENRDKKCLKIYEIYFQLTLNISKWKFNQTSDISK